MQEDIAALQLDKNGGGEFRSTKYQLHAQAVEKSPLAEFIYSPKTSVFKKEEQAPLVLDDFFLDVSESKPKDTDTELTADKFFNRIIENPAGLNEVVNQQNGQGRPNLSDVQEAQAPTFEGDGFHEVGSARKKASDVDDEFDYAFEGGQREGATHKQVFKAKPIPKHLLTNVKQQQLQAVSENEDAGEEEEEEKSNIGRKSDNNSDTATYEGTHKDGAQSKDPFLSTGKVFQNPAFVVEAEGPHSYQTAHIVAEGPHSYQTAHIVGAVLSHPDVRSDDEVELVSTREVLGAQPRAIPSAAADSAVPATAPLSSSAPRIQAATDHHDLPFMASDVQLLSKAQPASQQPLVCASSVGQNSPQIVATDNDPDAGTSLSVATADAGTSLSVATADAGTSLSVATADAGTSLSAATADAGTSLSAATADAGTS
ncbi:hypothetical protein CEUSTIGMA_g5887.t1, partial [Chlamydomonas eustigma]